MNNAMYGKTMRNLKNKIDVKLVGKKWASKPSLKIKDETADIDIKGFVFSF